MRHGLPTHYGWGLSSGDKNILTYRKDLASRAKSAHQIDDKAYHQNEADSAATDGRTAKVEAAAAEQKKKYENKEDKIHGPKIAYRDDRSYGAFTP